jgi:glucosamine-6-phosphate deaminase
LAGDAEDVAQDWEVTKAWGARVIIKVFEDKKALSDAAADHAARTLRTLTGERGHARIVVATGTSQLDFLDALTREKGIDWRRVEMFHLDEYVGLPITHPASFRKYLLDNLIRKTGIARYHLLDGERDPQGVVRAVGALLISTPIDLAFVGIGENGHLAFNDPPADFGTTEPYLLVELDETCRRQQVGEGWFADISDVPRRAISMSVHQIQQARQIIAVVPDARKAWAVKNSVEGEIDPRTPASSLRMHADVTLYLDRNSASLLRPATLSALAPPAT